MSTAARPTASRWTVLPEERFSCYSHGLGAAAIVVGTAFLAATARNATSVVLALVYGLSVAFLFTSSALYHAQKRGEDSQSLWRRLDHLAIFFMIAGSYTPVCWMHLQGGWRWSILATQWGLVLLGLVFKLLYIGSPRWVTASIYVTMGWIAAIPIHKLLQSWDRAEASLLLGGGVLYTLGAVIYALKRPDPWPNRVGFHGIFHVAVLIAAVLHYVAIHRMLS